MATVFDVAAYILKKQGSMTAMKLQKLVYYAQAWSLVWDDEPLFSEPIEAWVSGPVVRELYIEHKGRFTIDSIPQGNSDVFDVDELETLDGVLEHYGDKGSQWLSELTHREPPWLLARRGLSPTRRTSKEIALDSMVEYYSSLI